MCRSFYIANGVFNEVIRGPSITVYSMVLLGEITELDGVRALRSAYSSRCRPRSRFGWLEPS